MWQFGDGLFAGVKTEKNVRRLMSRAQGGARTPGLAEIGVLSSFERKVRGIAQF